ncbi:MAG: porin family protein [bacterium]
MSALRSLAVAAAVALLPIAVSMRAAAQQVGFTVGTTQSTVFTSYGNGVSGSNQVRTSLTLGGTYRHRLAPGIVAEPELLLVQRGWGTESQPTLSTSYLEVPLLLRFGALSQRGSPVRPVLTVGPAVNLLLWCDLSGTGLTRVAGSGCRKRIVEPFVADYRVPRLDVGAMAGLGLELRAPGGTLLGLEGRYEYGLTNVQPGQAGRSRNSTFFFLLNVVPGRSSKEQGGQ